MPATVELSHLRGIFKLSNESKFFPHISTEAPPVGFLVNGLEKVMSLLITNLADGLKEGKDFLFELQNLMALNLYRVT